MSKVEMDHFGVPPLAGVCTYEQACKQGYSVDFNVGLLLRYHYVKLRLNSIFAAHLARTPEWEVKCGYSLHLWLEAEHCAALRKRVSEMREPPLHLDKVPDEKLETLLDEAIRANDTLELLTAIYLVIKPEMIRSLEKHLAETNPLTDYPTCRILKQILQEEQDMADWGEKAVNGLLETRQLTADSRLALDAWRQHIQRLTELAGGIFGDLVADKEELHSPLRSDGAPYVMDAVPQRDERFKDNFNQSALIDLYYRDENLPFDERVYALLYKRLREMDVPEWMAPIIYKTKGKPWEYYVDMSRQLWDECRHAMMGEVGLYQDGMPFYAYPINVGASTVLNVHFEPLEAHTILWAIEQGLMPANTGKRYEWTIAEASDNRLAAMFQDYDWADEVLHAQIGRKWLTPEFGGMENMRAAASKISERWGAFGKQYGERSKHEPWWPEFIAEIRQRRKAEA